MALTVRANGSMVGGQPNNATASWWNDYHDLLTGGMTDQDITPLADLVLAPVIGAPSSAPTLGLLSGSALGIGVYKYVVTFSKQGQTGESNVSPAGTITTTSGNQSVALTNIPTGPVGTIARKLYRTVSGGSAYLLLATLADNTTTTYTDTVADGSLGAASPSTNTFGGRLLIKDASGAINASILPSGAATFASVAAGSLTVGGNPGLILGTGSFAGNHVYVSPNQPSGMVKGDVWVKTPFS